MKWTTSDRGFGASEHVGEEGKASAAIDLAGSHYWRARASRCLWSTNSLCSRVSYAIHLAGSGKKRQDLRGDRLADREHLKGEVGFFIAEVVMLVRVMRQISQLPNRQLW